MDEIVVKIQEDCKRRQLMLETAILFAQKIIAISFIFVLKAWDFPTDRIEKLVHWDYFHYLPISTDHRITTSNTWPTTDSITFT